MCYAAITKGAVALEMELLIAARQLGVEQILEARVAGKASPTSTTGSSAAPPAMPPKAYRWVPEMLEIAKTFEGVGMTPRIMQGAADMFEFIAATPLGQGIAGAGRAQDRSGSEVARQLADCK